MTGLVKAEWLKLRKQIFNWILLLIPLGLVAVAQLGSILVVALLNSPDVATSGNRAQNQAAIQNTAQNIYDGTFPPDTFIFGLGIVSLVKGILIILLFSNLVGSEYGQNTWKNILIRYPRRANFLVAKLLVGMYWLLIITLMTGLVGLVFGFAPNLIIPNIRGGLLAPVQDIGRSFSTLIASLIALPIQMLIVGAITIAATVLTRSTVAGLAITLVYTTFEGLAGSFIRQLHDFTLATNFNSLEDHLKSSTNSNTVPLIQNIAVLAAYLIVALTLAFWVFRRNDMAGV